MTGDRRPLWWAVLTGSAVLVAVAVLLAVGGRPGDDFGGTALEQSPEPTRTARPTDPAPSAPAESPATVPVVPAEARRAAVPTTGPVVPPVSIAIPVLGIDVPVRPVGVDDEGLMEIPTSGQEVGWYRFGPAPGADTGSSVLASHVNTRAEGEGVLARLGDLGPGDTVTVALEDGSTVDYAVTERRTVPKLDLDEAALFDRSGPHRLALVTCGGPWLEERSSYRDNVIVTAVPLPPSR